MWEPLRQTTNVGITSALFVKAPMVPLSAVIYRTAMQEGQASEPDSGAESAGDDGANSGSTPRERKAEGCLAQSLFLSPPRG
mmetsp:Transcript_41482/g.86668  ORF Transcript_41482/g.86668 Transcript_41482/m.86668 type:complete len:82 (-) Transcript_41482:749-994(-)